MISKLSINILKEKILKNIKDSRRIIIAIGAFVIVLVILSVFIILQPKQQNTPIAKVNTTTKKFIPVNLQSLKQDQFDLWINNSGPYDRVFDLRKKQKISIRLVTQNEKSAYITDYLLQNNLVTIQVDGANQTKDLKIIQDKQGGLSTSYIANNGGKDTITVTIKGTNIVYQSHLLIHDPAYFAVPIDLEPENISFTTGNSLTIKSKKKNAPGPAISDYTGFSDAWWNIDLPGNITYDFTSHGQKFDYAYLTIYAIKGDALQKYDATNPLDNFLYLKNLQALTQTIAQKPNLPEKLDIAEYPPTNAVTGPVSRTSFVDFQNGTGVRYLIAGWYQSYEASEFPTYTYQGITADGKYQVLFRYSKLYSPLLDNYLKSQGSLVDNYYNTNNQAFLDKYIHGSFDAVKQEDNFLPSITELDEFVKSIKVGI